MMQRITCNECGTVREGEYVFTSRRVAGDGCDKCNRVHALSVVVAGMVASAMMSVCPPFRAIVNRRAEDEAAVIGLKHLTGATEAQIVGFAEARRMPIQLLRELIASGRVTFEEVRAWRPDS